MSIEPIDRVVPLPGTLCWTKDRPFQTPALMLVLAAQNKATAVVEIPFAANSDGIEQGLEAALSQIEPQTVAAMNPRYLGPAIGRLTPEQYAMVRDNLRDYLSLNAA